MEKVKFNVSSKTARLIGRENISDSNGAIIELVKKMLIEEQKGKIYAKNVFWTRWGF